MRSIRKTLLAGTITPMAVLLVAAGAFLFVSVRAGLLRQFDRALLDKAAVLMASVEVKAGHTIFDDEDLDMGEFRPTGGPGFLQIVSESGETVYRSPSLADAAITRAREPGDDLRADWVRLPNGRQGRSVHTTMTPRVDEEGPQAAGVTAHAGAPVDFVFARDASPVTNTLHRIEITFLMFGAGVITLSTALLRVAIGRALRPVDALASGMNAIGPDDLTRPVALDACPLELAPVVDRLNAMLVRLKRAFDRERAFSADVAHELRTPLAGIRTTLEVALARPRTAPEYEAAMTECLDAAGGMQSMIENLLTLAQLDAGQLDIAHDDVDLGTIVQSVLTPVRGVFAACDIDVQTDIDGQLAVESDPSLVTIVVRNVIDNACAYTDPGGWTKVSAKRDGARAVLCVSNSGSAIEADHVDRVFDRFWRADNARSDTGAHAGLGLSLVQKIVSTLGGTVEVASRDGVFEIAIAIPVSRGPA